MTIEERLARVGLCAAVEPGTVAVARSVVRHGPVRTWRSLQAGDRELDPRGRWQRRASSIEAAAVLAAGQRAGLRFICPGDTEWPVSLDDLDHTVDEPEPVAPAVGLWVRGIADVGEICQASVAVAGSRAATEYGVRSAADLGADLTLAGWPVVSGAAFGIDQAAHRGALAAGGSPMAVLACGADQVYPSSHTRLLERITAEGAVVSELPPGATPTRARFLSRNRLIAGMTRGVTVVEAARRSGALSTATWAAKLGRPVAALPGPVTSALSVGCHDLVRHGAGTLATDAAEVLDAVGRLGIDAAPEPVNPDTVRDRLPDDVAETPEALPDRATATAAQLSARTGFTEQECAAALSMLRDHGMVHRRGAGWQLA